MLDLCITSDAESPADSERSFEREIIAWLNEIVHALTARPQHCNTAGLQTKGGQHDSKEDLNAPR